MCSKKQISKTNSEIDSETNIPHSNCKNCLNCGTELKGTYCHNCGQHITDHTITVKSFLLNYLDNAFWWDSKHFKTLRLLIGRPGFLTNEYLSGKFVSQVQPLKLNMFLLFVFITLFVSFSSPERINNPVQNLVDNDMFSSIVQMEFIKDDEVYFNKALASPRDTVEILAPLYIAQEYSSLINCHQVIYDTQGTDIDKWIAIIPHSFIEDNIIKSDANGTYRFNVQESHMVENLEIFKSVWDQLSELASVHFPMLILLTAPFLSLSLLIVLREKKRPFVTHFIFSMHYIAFVELIFIFIYLLYLIINPSTDILNIIFTFCSCTYLMLSFREVYKTSWLRSVTKALLSCGIYYAICFFIFCIVFIIACINVSKHHM